VKLSLLATTLLFTTISSSQTRIGIFAGPQITSAKYKIDGDDQETGYKFGFQVGMGLKLPFETNLFFAPSIFYSMKGYEVEFNKFSFPPGPQALDNNTTIHTLELAMLLQYDFGKRPSHFFLRAGPGLDFQLKGKEEFNLSGGGTTKRNMTFSFGDYGRYAASAHLHFGYETRTGFQFYMQYGHGLASINNADHGPVIKHRTLGLTVFLFL